MFTVDGKYFNPFFSSRFHDKITGHNQSLFVGQRYGFAGLNCRQRGFKAGGSDQRGYSHFNAGI